jgi:hypothetical protein
LSGIGIELFELSALTPEVIGIIPGDGYTGQELTDVIVSGDNFQGPGVEVKLAKSGEPDIEAENVSVADI